MTVQEFKKDYPKYADLEGDELWDAMTLIGLRHKQAEEISKQIKPFWKRYTLRWFIYRKLPSFILGGHKHSHKEVCSSCLKGSSSFIFWNGKVFCMCGAERKLIPNKSIMHKLWKVWNYISNKFWKLLDVLHIVRSSQSGRYDMFGDESRYVSGYRYTKNWEPAGRVMHTRKWWEYIFIEKP